MGAGVAWTTGLRVGWKTLEDSMRKCSTSAVALTRMTAVSGGMAAGDDEGTQAARATRFVSSGATFPLSHLFEMVSEYNKLRPTCGSTINRWVAAASVNCWSALFFGERQPMTDEMSARRWACSALPHRSGCGCAGL
jgi:hypothetical protein